MNGDRSLEGKVIIVTGGGRGLGRVMAEALAARGARLLLTGARTQRDLDETRSAIENGGGRCRTMLADVSDWSECQRVADAAEQFGGVYGLVNNAARSVRLAGDSDPGY